MKIKLPTDWSEVSLKQHARLLSNDQDESLTGVDLKAAHISVLSNTDFSVIEELTPAQINELFDRIKFIGSNEIKGEFPNVVKLGNKTYYCEPKASVSYGQYKAMREWTKTPDAANDNLHNIVALFLTEPNRPYSYNFEEKALLVKEHCNMFIVFKITGFFLKLYPELLKAIQTSSLIIAEREMKKARTEMEKLVKQKTTKPSSWKRFLGSFSKKK
jgi:hypothetical protein